MTNPTYEIFAIKYGERVGTHGSIFIHGDPHEAPLAMDYYIWAIRNEDRTIVVDTGFSKAEGERRGRTYTQSPREGLERVGIDPDSVKDVIISHMHYDHAGNLDMFPNARFHLQTAEMAFATGRGITFGVLGHSFTKEDVLQTLQATFANRVQYYSGDAEIAPGINVHFIGGHAAGLQCVSVETARGRVILATDAAHYYESFMEEPQFTTHIHMAGMLEGYRTLRRLAPADSHVVPGHDPMVLDRYPAAGPGLEGIAVRLDLPEQV
jgi:glyoxylase-like metal-dependent hydrolase (beta-lactamase superfamily II)